MIDRYSTIYVLYSCVYHTFESVQHYKLEIQMSSIIIVDVNLIQTCSCCGHNFVEALYMVPFIYFLWCHRHMTCPLAVFIRCN